MTADRPSDAAMLKLLAKLDAGRAHLQQSACEALWETHYQALFDAYPALAAALCRLMADRDRLQAAVHELEEMVNDRESERNRFLCDRDRLAARVAELESALAQRAGPLRWTRDVPTAPGLYFWLADDSLMRPQFTGHDWEILDLYELHGSIRASGKWWPVGSVPGRWAGPLPPPSDDPPPPQLQPAALPPGVRAQTDQETPSRLCCPCGGKYEPLKRDWAVFSVCKRCGKEGPFWAQAVEVISNAD